MKKDKKNKGRLTTTKKVGRSTNKKKNKKKIMTVTSLGRRGEPASEGCRGGEEEEEEAASVAGMGRGQGRGVVVVVVGVSTAVTWFFPKQQVPSN